MDAKSYSDINNLFKPSPGFATSMFIRWSDIAHIFDVTSRWDLVNPDDPTPIDIINIAFQEAQEWVSAYKKTTNKDPQDEILVDKENAIAESIMDHWSYGSVLAGNLPFKEIVDGINSWCLGGPKNKKLFVQTPAPKIGLSYYLNDLGINFTIYPSFIIPYTELYYEAYELLPDWNFEDLDAADVVETLYFYCGHANIPTTFDLADWDTKREKYT